MLCFLTFFKFSLCRGQGYLRGWTLNLFKMKIPRPQTVSFCREMMGQMALRTQYQGQLVIWSHQRDPVTMFTWTHRLLCHGAQEAQSHSWTPSHACLFTLWLPIFSLLVFSSLSFPHVFVSLAPHTACNLLEHSRTFWRMANYKLMKLYFVKWCPWRYVLGVELCPHKRCWSPNLPGPISVSLFSICRCWG